MTEKKKQKNAMPMSREDFLSMLGEGIHTAFRKGTDCKQAHQIWALIDEMESEDWMAVLEFVTWGFETSYSLKWKSDEVKT